LYTFNTIATKYFYFLTLNINPDWLQHVWETAQKAMKLWFLGQGFTNSYKAALQLIIWKSASEVTNRLVD
jgi:hypothetical protein